MALESIDALMMKIAKEARKKEHADVNDRHETLERLKALRPELYYKREDNRTKWSTGNGDYAGVLRMMGKLPVVKGVQVVAR
ncbi:hypothetical protein KY359_01170 [Candidatus Woesearchaeota archaeon]|nr:hypothetical protein [Candidatus Woesearchaeota archaeon]